MSAGREPFTLVVGVVGLVVAVWGMIMGLYGLVVPTEMHATPPAVMTTIPTPKPAVPTNPAVPVSIGPATLVQDFMTAINRKEYPLAWKLGGQDLSRSFPEFVRGYADVSRITLTIEAVYGDTVTVDLAVLDMSGARRTYRGRYVVAGNMIRSSTVALPGQ